MLSLSFSEKSSAHPLRHVRALGQLQQEQHCAKEKPHYALVKVNPVKRKGTIELQEVLRGISIETQRKHLGSQHNLGIIVKTESGPEMQHHLANSTSSTSTCICDSKTTVCVLIYLPLLMLC